MIHILPKIRIIILKAQSIALVGVASADIKIQRQIPESLLGQAVSKSFRTGIVSYQNSNDC